MRRFSRPRWPPTQLVHWLCPGQRWSVMARSHHTTIVTSFNLNLDFKRDSKRQSHESIWIHMNPYESMWISQGTHVSFEIPWTSSSISSPHKWLQVIHFSCPKDGLPIKGRPFKEGSVIVVPWLPILALCHRDWSVSKAIIDAWVGHVQTSRGEMTMFCKESVWRPPLRI